MMHMNEIDNPKQTYQKFECGKQATISVAFEETFKLRTEVDQMREEIHKQQETVQELQAAVSLYEVTLREKDKQIGDLQQVIGEKEKIIHTELDNYDKLILNHVDMEKKLIADVEKGTVYVRSFIVAVMMIAMSALFFV